MEENFKDILDSINTLHKKYRSKEYLETIEHFNRDSKDLVKILEKYGFKVSSLYIAQIKDKCGLGKERTGNNWKKNDKSKEPQCTPEKEEAIRDAFNNFDII